MGINLYETCSSLAKFIPSFGNINSQEGNIHHQYSSLIATESYISRSSDYKDSDFYYSYSYSTIPCLFTENMPYKVDLIPNKHAYDCSLCH